MGATRSLTAAALVWVSRASYGVLLGNYADRIGQVSRPLRPPDFILT